MTIIEFGPPNLANFEILVMPMCSSLTQTDSMETMSHDASYIPTKMIKQLILERGKTNGMLQ